MDLKPCMTQGEIPRLVINRAGDKVPNPDYPKDCRCKSGHIAPYGTRFFAVSGPVVPEAVQGVYCELCLNVANRKARLSKRGDSSNFDVHGEFEKGLSEIKRGAQ